MLRFRLDQQDLDRMHELAVKNQDDALTASEKVELETFESATLWTSCTPRLAWPSIIVPRHRSAWMPR